MVRLLHSGRVLRPETFGEIAVSYVRSVIAIAICAGLGALAAWQVVSWTGLTGIGAALLLIVIGMVAATVLFAGGVALGRALCLIH